MKKPFLRMFAARASIAVTTRLTLLLLLASGFVSADAQNVGRTIDEPPALKGLAGVAVVVKWTGGAPGDRDAIQAAVESKLRQAGMPVLAEAEWVKTSGLPILYVAALGTGGVIPVTVELHEMVSLVRRTESAFLDRLKQSDPPTMAEMKEKYSVSDGIVWHRCGAAQTVPSAQAVMARYKADIAKWGVMPEATKRLMTLEVQAAIADAQHFNFSAVPDLVKQWVDEFLNDWLSMNPKQR
jgi:hypothetical protein